MELACSRNLAPKCSAITLEHGLVPLFRSEEHTSELQSQSNLVCRLLLEKKSTERPRPNYLSSFSVALNPPASANGSMSRHAETSFLILASSARSLASATCDLFAWRMRRA